MRKQQHRGAKREQALSVREVPLRSDTEPDLGSCCICRKTDKTVRNILMLSRLAPVAGTGWGCAVCRLPSNGALAVVCDACLKAHPDPFVALVDVCAGYMENKGRLPIAELSDVTFDHDMRLHEGFFEEEGE